MYDYRPEIHLEKTTFQKIANIIGYTIFIACCIVSLISLTTLPNEVPIHFNVAGEADGWGSKYVLLLLPFIGIITVLALEALEKRPHKHNYPSYINESNVRSIYAISIRTLNLVKNGILITFGLLQFEIMLSAKNATFSFGYSTIIILIVLVVGPIIWHIKSMSEVKKETKELSNK